MAADITAAILSARVVIDDAAAKKELDTMGQKAEAAQGHLSGLLGKVFSFAGAGLAFFGVQTGLQGILGLAGNLFGQQENLENVNTAFTRLLGSSKKAADEIKHLQQVAADTPLELPDLETDTQMLLGFGFSLSQVDPIITSFGDALSATGNLSSASLKQVIMVLGQMHASTTLHTQDLMQLSSVGINAFQILADSIKPTKKQIDDLVRAGLIPAGDASHYLSGKIKLTAGDIQQLVTDGLIPSQQGIEALTIGIENNPIYKGGMAAQSQTTAGRISTLKDNLTQAALVMSKPIFDEFSHIIDRLGQAVSSPDFQNFAKTVGQDVAGALKTTIDATKNVIAWTIQWHEPILIVAGALTLFFIPALIKSGVEAVIAGVKITGQFIASLIKSGVEGYTAAGKIAIWTANVIKSGVEAVIAGGKISVSWIANVFKAGETAKASAAEVETLATAEQAVGEKAAASTELETLATAEQAVGEKAAASAAQVDTLTTSEDALGKSATTATGTAGTGAAGAGGLGVMGLIGALVYLGNYLTLKVTADWVGSKIVDFLKSLGSAADTATKDLRALHGIVQTVGEDLYIWSEHLSAFDAAIADANNMLLAAKKDLLDYDDAVRRVLGDVADVGTKWTETWKTIKGHPFPISAFGPAGPPSGGGSSGSGGSSGGGGGTGKHASGGVVGPAEMLSLINDVPGGAGELVHLPTGTLVFTHDQSVALLQQMQREGRGARGGLTVHQTFNGVYDPYAIQEATGLGLKREMLLHGF